MRTNHGPEYRVLRLKPFAMGVLVALFAFLAQANEYIPRGQPIPQNVRVVGTNVAGIDLRASAVWMNPVGQTTNHVVPVSIPASRVGQLAKAAIRRGLPGLGWGMLLKDLVNGAGWAIDELTQQVVSAPSQEPEPLGEVAYCKMVGQGVMRCASNPARVVDLYAHDNINPDYVSWHFRTDRGRNEACALNAGGVRVICYDIRTVVRPTQGWDGYANGNQGTDAVPVSDADLGNLLKQSPQVVNAILIDPDTGAPIRTPELIDAMNNLRRQLEAANGLDPGPDMDPSDDYTDTVPNQTEFPEFCMWADVVCDFIDWFKKDDSEFKELPETELQIDPSDWQSGIGGGECPVMQPITVTGPGGYTGEVTFDWQPLCSGATKLKPFLIAVCVMVAAFIVAGLRKSAV